jgi:hypothetical protein
VVVYCKLLYSCYLWLKKEGTDLSIEQCGGIASVENILATVIHEAHTGHSRISSECFCSGSSP